MYEALPRSVSSSFWCVRFGLISVRCQTVPSPFGSGLSDFEVAPCVLHSLLKQATVVERRLVSAPQLNSPTNVTSKPCASNPVCQEGRVDAITLSRGYAEMRWCTLNAPLSKSSLTCGE
jgi:hypothetical protein